MRITRRIAASKSGSGTERGTRAARDRRSKQRRRRRGAAADRGVRAGWRRAVAGAPRARADRLQARVRHRRNPGLLRRPLHLPDDRLEELRRLRPQLPRPGTRVRRRQLRRRVRASDGSQRRGVRAPLRPAVRRRRDLQRVRDGNAVLRVGAVGGALVPVRRHLLRARDAVLRWLLLPPEPAVLQRQVLRAHRRLPRRTGPGRIALLRARQPLRRRLLRGRAELRCRRALPSGLSSELRSGPTLLRSRQACHENPG